jgi:hypothetical protein
MEKVRSASERQRPRVGLRALLGIGLVVAVAGCGSNGDQAKKALAAGKAQASREIASARSQIRSEQAAAQSDLAAVRQDTADARQRLTDEKRKVSAERARLRRLTRQVNGVASVVARNTIAGSGTFVVGGDVSPGTYRAAASPGCYWARLRSLDTNDIIDNDNADGPLVVEILPSDKAFTTNGCADFHKVG